MTDLVVYHDVLDFHHTREKLQKELTWERRVIRAYGREVLESRYTAYYGDLPYTYSGSTRHPRPWNPTLEEYREIVERYSQTTFNSCLVNYYENGRVGLGMHRDDEPELGENPVVATLSLGAPRTLLHEANGQTQRLLLSHGDLVVMNGWTLHGIEKDKTREPRVSLTFRTIKAEKRE
jgi:alkylated DNA repair dioxygenase AlkB